MYKNWTRECRTLQNDLGLYKCNRISRKVDFFYYKKKRALKSAVSYWKTQLMREIEQHYYTVCNRLFSGLPFSSHSEIQYIAICPHLYASYFSRFI